MTLATPAAMIEVLLPIWQRLFERSSIGPQDNFFDLGGDPTRAVALFHEIAFLSGRNLPPMLIYQAPTIAALSKLLEFPDVPSFAPIVPLNFGTRNPPVFFLHGLGGSVMELFSLIQHLPRMQRAYGMQMPGLDGRTPTPETIESVAAFYVASIKSVQPQGPYYLVGYSLGGLIALEIAQQLSADGNPVGLLAMIDSFPHVKYLSPTQRARLEAKLALRRIWKSLSPTPSASARRALPQVNAALAPPMESVRRASALAWKRYRPRFYNGTIVFLKAADHSMFPDNPLSVWAHLARKIEVESLPGDHLTILSAHAASLASAVARHLDRTAE